MPNFTQICYIATDYHSKAPVLEEAKTQSGKDIFKGKLIWLDGKTKEGKNHYQKVKFFTYDRNVFDTFKNNKGEAFKVEGWLKINRWESKDKIWQYTAEIQVVNALVYVAGDKKSVQNFHEVGSSEEDSEIPF